MSATLPRSLDHIVHAVRDLDAAARLYETLGFTVGARNRHPWGTHNRVVQFDGIYIELLTVAEPGKIAAHGPRAFSFGAFHRDFLTAREGLSMLLLKSTDAEADARVFAAAGIGDFDTFHFAREGRGPDGAPVPLAFTLAFAADPLSPRAGFGVCQHHVPENFWSAAMQRHVNGVTGIAGVVLVADNPTDHHVFLKSLLGSSDLHATSLGVSIRGGNAGVAILDPAAFASATAVPVAVDAAGAQFAALRFATPEPESVGTRAAAAGIATEQRGGRAIVPPSAAFGATLIFEPPAQG